MSQSAIPIIAQAQQHGDRHALIGPEGEMSYAELLRASAGAAAALLNGRDDLGEARVAFLVPPGLDYVMTQWGIWRAGGLAVPLCVQHPEPELDYVVGDSDPETIVAHPSMIDRVRGISERRKLRLLSTDDLRVSGDSALPTVDPSRRAMMLYTSGSTGRPKGVVTTHANNTAQIESLVEAWAWSADDHILHTLPLHHIHGVINVLGCALWAGATCEILPKFDVDAVWRRIGDGDLTLYMAVPTIYAKLIAAYDEADASARQRMTGGAHNLRLMVSGSAALPVSTLDKWRELTGHTLLERYGMTEIGMAISNPLNGERRSGHIGQPLPKVQARLADEQTGKPLDNPDAETPGEIQVKGPTVFLEYWRRPDATEETFTDGWFRTGDVAVISDGYYRILGRSSVDIIKTGGFKVSALEIEDALRQHPAIRDCAVVGVEDAEWGEQVSAAIVTPEGETPVTLEALRDWAKQQIAAYKVPRRIMLLDDLPRNAMGKVVKPEVRKLFEAETADSTPS